MSNPIRPTAVRAFLCVLVVLSVGLSRSHAGGAYQASAYDAYAYASLAESQERAAYRYLYRSHHDRNYTLYAYWNAATAQAYAYDTFVSGGAIYSDYAYSALFYADMAYYYALDAYNYAADGDYDDAMIFADYANSYSSDAATYSYMVYLGY